MPRGQYNHPTEGSAPLPGEEFLPVDGWPGYEASNLGRVRSSRAGRGWRVLAGGRDKDGYRQLVLSAGVARRQTRRVAHLVADAFLGPRPVGMVVAHENGINTDDRAANLRYKSQRDNIRDKERHGTAQRGERNWRASMTEKQAKAAWALRGEMSAADAARVIGVSRSAVYGIWRRRSWRHIHDEAQPKNPDGVLPGQAGLFA